MLQFSVKFNLLIFCLALISETKCQYESFVSSTDLHRNCDLIITQSEQWTMSPNYPSNYPNGLACIYSIKRFANDVCALELLLTDFELQKSFNCNEDFLELSDGQRLCGSLPINSKRILEFPSADDTLRLRFVSNEIESGHGFIIKFRQLRNSCGMNFTDQWPKFYPEISVGNSGYAGFPSGISPSRTFNPHEFDTLDTPAEQSRLHVGCSEQLSSINGFLRTPNFPYPYPSKRTCLYLFRRFQPNICKIKLKLRSFDLLNTSIGTSLCLVGDYLELPDGARLCGQLRQETHIIRFKEGSDYLPIHFRSDAIGASSGFDIEYEQMQNSCEEVHPLSAPKCDQTLKSETRFTSPGYPESYSPNRLCVYSIQKLDSSVCGFTLNFRKLELEDARDSSGLCIKDYLQLPDGRRLCGNVTGTQTFSYNALLNHAFTKHPILIFSSDEKQETAGFDIQITQIVCDHFSPNSRDMTTSRNSINSSGGTLNFPQNFSLYDNNNDKIPTRTDSFNWLTPQLGVLPKVADAPLNPMKCDRMITSPKAIISSPRYPKDYPPNIDCLYTLYPSSEDICQVRLRFLSFDLERSFKCQRDYFLVQNTGEKVCGNHAYLQDMILDYPSPSGSIALQFVSDSELSHSGFEIKVEQLYNSCSKRQGKSLVWTPSSPSSYLPLPVNSPRLCSYNAKMQFTFDSPNFPLTYAPNTHCAYRVYRANERICALEIKFAQFNVGQLRQGHCPNDFLEIDSQRFCGDQRGLKLLVPFPTALPFVSFRFYSDSQEDQLGFRMNVRQLQGDECDVNRRTGVDAYGPVTGNGYSTVNDPYIGYQGGLISAVYGALAPATYTGWSASNLQSAPSSSNALVKPMNLHYFNTKAMLRNNDSSSQICPEREYRDFKVRISSPKHKISGDYPTSIHCVYRIWKAEKSVCAVQFTFHHFKLENSRNCDKDRLQYGVHRFCGHLPSETVRTYEFADEVLHIVFESDSYNTDAGFELTLSQMIC